MDDATQLTDKEAAEAAELLGLVAEYGGFIRIPTRVQIERIERLKEIRAEILALQREQARITGGAELREFKDTLRCLRCGNEWWPNSPFALPRCCPRCCSTAWMKPPTATSRKPGDPPAPSWKRRQARKGPPVAKLRIRPDKRKVQAAPPSPFELPPAAPLLTPPPPIEESVKMLPDIPPPPSISLYDHLRRTEPAPQPEVVTSHPTSLITPKTIEQIAEPLPQEMIAEYQEEVAAMPEDVGVPRTDAEREELQKAQEEAWPTTRPDD
jgi:hypothetical protein